MGYRILEYLWTKKIFNLVKAKWNIYLGYLNDATGIHLTKDKVQAIKEAPVPNDITQLRVFVVLINYYGKFTTGGNTHGSFE